MSRHTFIRACPCPLDRIPSSLTSLPSLPECISHPCRSCRENRREIRISLISGTLSVYACFPGDVNAMAAVVLASRDARLLLSGVLDRVGRLGRKRKTARGPSAELTEPEGRLGGHFGRLVAGGAW